MANPAMQRESEEKVKPQRHRLPIEEDDAKTAKGPTMMMQDGREGIPGCQGYQYANAREEANSEDQFG